MYEGFQRVGAGLYQRAHHDLGGLYWGPLCIESAHIIPGFESGWFGGLGFRVRRLGFGFGVRFRVVLAQPKENVLHCLGFGFGQEFRGQ